MFRTLKDTIHAYGESLYGSESADGRAVFETISGYHRHVDPLLLRVRFEHRDWRGVRELLSLLAFPEQRFGLLLPLHHLPEVEAFVSEPDHRQRLEE